MQPFTIVIKYFPSGNTYPYVIYRSSRRAAFLWAIYRIRYKRPLSKGAFFIV